MPVSIAHGAYALSLCSYIGPSYSSGRLRSSRPGLLPSMAGGGFCRHLVHGKHMGNLPATVRAEVQVDGSSTSTASATEERSEADKLVDGMSFGQLCDDFECISSPAVEATARQLARDILEMREDNKALGSFALFVKYKDPLRSFTGREKYKRSSWMKAALDNPSVAVQGMAMQSTGILNIKWVIRGRLKFSASFSSDLILGVNSTFTLNQISGQVIEHVEEWDLAGSPIVEQAYFWVSRFAYSALESGRDAGEAVKAVRKLLERGKDNDLSNIFSDPSGDPTKVKITYLSTQL
eukprot:c24135_g1_i1 orf=990-1871(-)